MILCRLTLTSQNYLSANFTETFGEGTYQGACSRDSNIGPNARWNSLAPEYRKNFKIAQESRAVACLRAARRRRCRAWARWACCNSSWSRSASGARRSRLRGRVSNRAAGRMAALSPRSQGRRTARMTAPRKMYAGGAAAFRSHGTARCVPPAQGARHQGLRCRRWRVLADGHSRPAVARPPPTTRGGRYAELAASRGAGQRPGEPAPPAKASCASPGARRDRPASSRRRSRSRPPALPP